MSWDLYLTLDKYPLMTTNIWLLSLAGNAFSCRTALKYSPAFFSSSARCHCWKHDIRAYTQIFALLWPDAMTCGRVNDFDVEIIFCPSLHTQLLTCRCCAPCAQAHKVYTCTHAPTRCRHHCSHCFQSEWWMTEGGGEANNRISIVSFHPTHLLFQRKPVFPSTC